MSNVSRQPASGGMLRLLIIDRYLLRQFLQTFLICFFSLTGLYVVIDGFANLEEFIEYGRKQGGLLKVMGEYYAYRSLSFFDTMSPILTLISAMFTVTWIQRHNELTAIEAAGIPKSRVIRPVIVAAVAIALLGALINRELIIPRVRHHLSHNAQALGGNTAKALIPRYDNETDILLGSSASKTYSVEQRIHRPDFYMPPGLDRYGPRVTAENAFFRPPQDGRPGGYLFRQVELPKSIATLPSLSLYGRKVLLTPHDTDWLAPDECFIASNLSFEYLDGGAALRQYSSTFELVRGLRNRSLDFGADERLAIHARFVQPVQDLTLLFLGLPLVLSRSNRNVFFAIGLCLALVVAFSAIVIGSRYLGSSYWLEPALGAWLPLMIFIPCAVALSGPFRE